jgi:hypothetical protein
MDSGEVRMNKPNLNLESELLSQLQSLQSKTSRVRKETLKLREQNREISLKLSMLKKIRQLESQDILTN